MTLTEFLLARIAEDETVARAAVGTAALANQTGKWQFKHVRDQYGSTQIVFAVAERGVMTQAADMTTAWESDERGRHIVRWDPARVLAECEAKRRIMGLHWTNDPAGPAPICNLCLYKPPCETLTYLALPYADHPDYDESWRL